MITTALNTMVQRDDTDTALVHGQVQRMAATLLISVDASPVPDSPCIRGTAQALTQLLSSLGELSALHAAIGVPGISASRD